MTDLTTLLAGIKERAAAAMDYPGHVTVEQSAADVPRLVAAIEGVAAAHLSIEVFEYDDTNGTWKLDADGEQIPAGTFCRTCSDSNVIEEIEDCEYDIAGNYGAVSWPCPTITAVVAALGGGE